MKKRITLALFAAHFMFAGCGKTAVEEHGVILKIEDIASRSKSEVEAILGKSEKSEKVKGYPCEQSDCTREFFSQGKYEIIFKEGKADRITIMKTPDLTKSDEAIAALGLPVSEPTFNNEGSVKRWEGVNDLKEVSFFPDYILVMVTEPDEKP